MTSRPAHLLLAVAVGLVASPRAGVATPGAVRPVLPAAIEPVTDVPAPLFWDVEAGRPVGANAHRFEPDALGRASGLSAWYYLAYLPGGQRLRVYEHNPPTPRGANSVMANSQDVAWRAANGLAGTVLESSDTIPDWARPRTGNNDGSSAGLLFALADLDLLTPGLLAATVRVAATGAIWSDGAVTAVRMVDAKLAAARVAGVDVFFAPALSADMPATTRVLSHLGSPARDRAIGDWLNMAAYERAGQAASLRPGSLAVVEVDDVRQALAWLCGRTGGRETCAVAHEAAGMPLLAARPYIVAAVDDPAPRRSLSAAETPA